MRTLIKGGLVYTGTTLAHADILLEGGTVITAETGLPDLNIPTVDAGGLSVSPAFVDLHVHLREPGYPEKETMRTGTMAAARGGFATICAMPNTNPVPDALDTLRETLRAIVHDACVRVLPFCAITRGELGQTLVEFETLAPHCIGFSDDGRGVQNGRMMREAMRRVKACDGLIAAHCEDDALAAHGVLHDGDAARRLGLPGISSTSEYMQVARDIELCAQTGARYHICHVSTAESLALVRDAKARGLPVTCEVTPHHAVLCDEDIDRDDGIYKMNPPLRSEKDRQAIRDALCDGTIDAIATDHAPHTAAQKAGGLTASAFGVVGLETAFAVLHTRLVRTGVLPLERLLALMTHAPARVIGLDARLAPGARADIVLIDADRVWTVDSTQFFGKGRSTPFDGATLSGDIAATMTNGRFIYESRDFARRKRGSYA